MRIKGYHCQNFSGLHNNSGLFSISGDENIDIPQWQKEEVEKRKEQVENGIMKTKSWSKAREDIFKK